MYDWFGMLFGMVGLVGPMSHELDWVLIARLVGASSGGYWADHCNELGECIIGHSGGDVACSLITLESVSF